MDEEEYIYDGSAAGEGNAGEAAAQEAASAEYASKGDAPWWENIGLPAEVQYSISDIAFASYGSGSGPVNASKIEQASQPYGSTEPPEQSAGEKITDKLTGVEDWIKKNPKSTDVILGMIAAAAKGSSDRDVADRAARGRIEEQNNADRLKQEESKRVSDSVTGIKKATRGLIPQYLKRKDGSRVFQPGGKLTGA